MKYSTKKSDVIYFPQMDELAIVHFLDKTAEVYIEFSLGGMRLPALSFVHFIGPHNVKFIGKLA